MIRHPQAYEVALTIASTKVQVSDMEEAAYETLVRIGDANNWSDEKRADLYARIAETMPQGPAIYLDHLVTVVSNALWATEKIYG